MKMTEDQLKAITDAEMRNAVGYIGGKMAEQRRKAMYYYMAAPVDELAPPEVEGRSTVVSPDVRNTIEAMLPQLMVKFAGSERPVEFEPRKEGDDDKAAQATDYVNYIYHTLNQGESISYMAIKDALLSKVGFVKVWWDDRFEEKREEYKGLTDFELAELLEDEEIEVIEQTSYADEDDAKQRQEAIEQLTAQLQNAQMAAQQGDQRAMQAIPQIQAQIDNINQQPAKMLFDVACKRKPTEGRVRLDNVPPEEILIARDAKTIADARFIGHRVQRTMSELKSQGYKNLDQIGSEENSWNMNMERIERLTWDDELAAYNTDTWNNLDDSQRRVWVTECYIRADYDGDGIAELRKVVRAGNQILENEIVDCAPFVAFKCLPMPHKFFGLSVADLAIPGQRINTALLRSTLDNAYLETNGRYFAVEGQVNLDDLLTSRPGGVVRISTPGAVGRLDQGAGNTGLSLNMLEFMKGFQEDATGWTRYNSGMDGDSLNQTATGVNQITNRADMRLDLIARNLAIGFRDLFNMILKLVCQFQNKAAVVKLRGKWTPVDPRQWRNGFEATVNVGLGTGSKDQLVAHLMTLSQFQANAFQIGVANPKNVYELGTELAEAMGFRSGDKYFSDPATNPPPQKPDPEQMKAQAQMQIEQLKAQTDKEVEQFKAQVQAQVDANRQEQEARQHSMKIEAEKQLEMLRAQLDAAKQEQDLGLKKYLGELQSQTQIYLKQMELGQRSAEMGAEKEAEMAETPEVEAEMAEPKQDPLQGLAQSIQQLIGVLASPKRVVRDQMGRAVGVEHVTQQ